VAILIVCAVVGVVLLVTLISRALDTAPRRPPFLQASPTPCVVTAEQLEAAPLEVWRQLC
jgi:hypothetical protein